MGRLIEVRSFGKPGPRELQTLVDAMAVVEATVASPWITVVDVRQTITTSDATAQGIIALMMQYNARTERAAYLLGRQSLFAVQMEAIVLRARNPERRVFRKRDELVDWLGERCAPEERQRLQVFLET